MEHNKLESARFAQVTDQEISKLTGGVEKALSESAARGFPVPGGDSLSIILDLTQEAKGKVVEGLGKAYDERSGQIYEVEKFALEYMVKIAKYAMELYRAQLFNAIELEQAQQASDMERGRADISRLNSQIEGRMAAIIRDKADMESRIAVYKQQQVDAEELTVAAESILEDAKLSTAEMKLDIIDSIREVLAAEQLVLAAEQRRAASLELVLEAQQVVAGIKREMIPDYVKKADARKALATATENEIPILEAIERLGYDRITLKNADEDEKHQERLRTLEYEIAQEDYYRAHSARELTKAQFTRLMLEYGNSIKAALLDLKKGLMQDEVAFKLSTGLAREAIDINNSVALQEKELANLVDDLTSLLANIETRAMDEADRIEASAKTSGKQTTTHLVSRRIREGFILG